MLVVLSTISFVNALLTRIKDLPETAFLLFFGIGLVVLTVIARRMIGRTTKASENLAKTHLSEHGRRA
jgi:hypothetical protein